MKRAILVFLLNLASLGLLPKNSFATNMTANFDFDWKFSLGDSPGAENPAFNDSTWRELNLPHDWSIEITPTQASPGKKDNGFFPGGVGWYRKHFVPPADAASHKVFIQFDGVYMNSKVYLNGHLLGERPYGYVSFQYDLTPWLKLTGDNVIAVRVDHSNAPTSRWYSGSGIYRHVWLSVLNPLHVGHWGTFVTTPTVSVDAATVNIQTEIQNDFADTRNCTILTIITDSSGQTVAHTESEQSLAAASRAIISQSLQVPHPELWSIETPTLYFVKTTVQENGNAVDVYRTPFGIRTVKFDPSHGLSINGKNIKLKGVCIHDDAGSVGVAVPERAWERRLEILRELGCNAIRLSHNPPAPEFLDLCDRMGFVMVDEAFDKWKSGYYKDYFDNWWQVDLDAMLRRDRNHPSVILWSVGNEVAEQGTPEGAQRLKMLVEHTHQVDPSRLVTCAMRPDGTRIKSDAINGAGFADEMDVAGYNYQEQWYDIDKDSHPNRIILGTESYPYYMGSNDYHTKDNLLNGNCDFTTANPWYTAQNKNYVVGEFIWSGIDYLGESFDWPSKGWCNAIIDTCGFLKPRAGFFSSVWNSRPVIEIAVRNDTFDIDTGHAAWSWPNLARSWNFPVVDQVIRVETFSNCQKVELFLNDKSLGVRQTSDYPNNTIDWNVPYLAGSLYAIGSNDGEKVAHDYLATAGLPARIELMPDRTSFSADGQDIVNIEVRLLDDKGNLVPNNDRPITFKVVGPGALIGIDNGDLRSTESYKKTCHRTYFGRELAIVQSSREAGTLYITAQSAGLPTTTISLKTLNGIPQLMLSEHR